MRRFLLLSSLLLFHACAMTPSSSDPETIRYMPLGDSYTIGTGTSPDVAWPTLLTDHLKRDGIGIELIANPARTAFDVRNVLDVEFPQFAAEKPTFSTLLIGVNDFVRGHSEEQFRADFVELVEKMLTVLPPSRLLIITIPDFSVTPVGTQFGDPQQLNAGIAAFNAIIKDEAAKRGLSVADLFPISQTMTGDSGLVAPDGLHPSEAGHASWEVAIYPAAKQLLER